MHAEGFDTASGKAILTKRDWNNVAPFQREFAPEGDELWVTNMRAHDHWQSQFDDKRIPYRWARFPGNMLEINPVDVQACDIESSDQVLIENKGVAWAETGDFEILRLSGK